MMRVTFHSLCRFAGVAAMLMSYAALILGVLMTHVFVCKMYACMHLAMYMPYFSKLNNTEAFVEQLA